MRMLSRRAFLRGITMIGLGGILAACSPTPAPKAPTVAPTLEQVATKLPEATAVPPTPAPTAIPASPVAQAEATSAPTVEPTSQAKEPTPAAATDAYMAIVRGPSPEELTKRAIAAIGGIERFVKNGYDVIVKPNICNANHGPEYASTTNPEVVATLVKLALGAGAKRVRVMDYPFAGSPQQAYKSSKIEEAVKAAGGEMELMAAMKFVETKIPNGVNIKSWPIYQPVLEADLVINLPIAKDHGLARLTLAGKNLMGVIENRPSLHNNINQRLADLATLIKPQLTVIDAVRILMANGPTGGNLKDVKETNMVIASADMVAADTYATSLFDIKPEEIGYIVASQKAGLGTMDLASVKVAELNL